MARGLFLTRLAGWFVGMGCLLGLAACGPSAPQPSKAALASDTWVLNPAQTFKGASAKELALARAAQDGDIAKINHLMRDEHVSPDRVFGDDVYVDGDLPLLAWPILTQQPDALKAMLDNGANPNARKPGGIPSGVAKALAKMGDKPYDCPYDSAMVWAAKAEDPTYLKLLLAHGGDPNAYNVNCETLMFQAFIWHGQWQNVQVLVEHGARVNTNRIYDPNRPNATGGATILSDYTSYGDFDKAWWLIAHGADPHYPRSRYADGSTRYKVLEDIFWYPSRTSVYQHWQTGLQCWALQHGYHRPSAMPDYYRRLRREYHVPDQERDIPLPDCKGVATPASSGLIKEENHATAH